QSLGIDLLSASGHKIHASKGVGFLYKKKSIHIANTVFGGGQEKGLRSGTECVPLISGLKGAIESLGNIKENLKKTKELRDYAIDELLKTGLVTINSNDNSLPYILNISVIGYRSETLLHFLESKNVFVSSGSACSKGHGSYVLKEIGLDARRTDSALRISFSRFSTKEDIDALCNALCEACSKLRKA
ncbi:MAG: aminotransferase class V-fold PLP-dependent enzyme, partial [Clostridia bacterium]|nr:aminotransferase class V-fold PLP-dependent enzyme [Clostridia bacterium]